MTDARIKSTAPKNYLVRVSHAATTQYMYVPVTNKASLNLWLWLMFNDDVSHVTCGMKVPSWRRLRGPVQSSVQSVNVGHVQYSRQCQTVRRSTDRLLVSSPVHPVTRRLHQHHLLGQQVMYRTHYHLALHVSWSGYTVAVVITFTACIHHSTNSLCLWFDFRPAYQYFWLFLLGGPKK